MSGGAENISDITHVVMGKLTSKSTINLVEYQSDMINQIRLDGLHRYILQIRTK